MKTNMLIFAMTLAFAFGAAPRVGAQPPPNCPPFCCPRAQHAQELKLVQTKLAEQGVASVSPELTEAIVKAFIHPSAEATAANLGSAKDIFGLHLPSAGGRGPALTSLK